MKIPKPWWETDSYEDESPISQHISMIDLAGPMGVALVRAWPDGRTDRGWGDADFMASYQADKFNARAVLYGHKRGKWAYAFIMRSMRLVCVDIDGKNGGLEHVKKLGSLPATLSETSKSGNGYHLFYYYDEPWDDLHGYGSIHDRIGIEQGVDIRSTGCVYHHDTQRWNDRAIAPLPKYLRDLLISKQQERAHRTAAVAAILDSDDPMEVLLMQDQLLTDLAKPIAPGKRNNTLFAIGQQLKTAQVPSWQDHLAKRAEEVGLDADEVTKLVSNVERYQ